MLKHCLSPNIPPRKILRSMSGKRDVQRSRIIASSRTSTKQPMTSCATSTALCFRTVCWNLVAFLSVRSIEICGHIPLTTERLRSYAESRHSQSVIPTIPFEFICYVPNPRLNRIITRRDDQGRIVNSRSRTFRA